MKRDLLIYYSLAFCTFPVLADKTEKQNVIFILADDLGWADLECYGSNFYETPNIDNLAKKGVKFNRAYAASPISSAARGAIMTGKYPSRTGYTGLPAQRLKPSLGRIIDADFEPDIKSEEFTLAEAFHDNGYKTIHIGKWHLGTTPETMPLCQGFDTYYSGYENGKWKNGRFNDKGEFITDVLTDMAIESIKNSGDEPFFLNLWYYAVHTPIMAKSKDISYFKDKAREMGLDTIKAVVQGEPFPAIPWFLQEKGDKRNGKQRRIIQSNPVYAAFLYCLDQNIGRIVKCLEDMDLMDNTTIVFYSDNGGLSTAEGSPTCNSPLKDGKGWDSEGGVRVPLIIYSPVFYNKSHENDGIITGTDIYPTLLDICGLPQYPNQHIDGMSRVSLLKGEKENRGPFLWHSPHYFNQGGYPFDAVLYGNWKYIYRYDLEKSYLYNLSDDIGEKNNLIEKNPHKYLEMKKMVDEYLDSIDAKYPRLNPDSLQKIFSRKEFHYTPVSGIGYEEGVSRRDPSDVIMVNDTCYVYYTKIYGKTSGYYGRIWCAYSVDEGYNWHEIGEVLSVGRKGTFDSFAVFTPNIIKWDNKYYMYYTGVKPSEGTDTFNNDSYSDYTALGVAVSESPIGPFVRVSDEPVLVPGKDKDDFDSYRIDDASLLYRDNRFWLYYKGRRYNDFIAGNKKTHMGVAFSDSPKGPFVKYGSPLLGRSHEVMIWPYYNGVFSLASFSSSIEYASDGLSFGKSVNGIYKKNRPAAPGAFRPDLTDHRNVNNNLKWGIAMILKKNKCYLERFSFN